MKRITLVLVAVLVLSGCRTAKPTVVSETIADSVAVSADSTFSLRHDSASISEEAAIMANHDIEFVEGGGGIYISADGSAILSCISRISSSRTMSSAISEDSDKLEMRTQSKDSVIAVHQSASYSETQPKASSGKSGKTMKFLVYLFGLVIILMLTRKLRQTLINLE